MYMSIFFYIYIFKFRKQPATYSRLQPEHQDDYNNNSCNVIDYKGRSKATQFPTTLVAHKHNFVIATNSAPSNKAAIAD